MCVSCRQSQLLSPERTLPRLFCPDLVDTAYGLGCYGFGSTDSCPLSYVEIFPFFKIGGCSFGGFGVKRLNFTDHNFLLMTPLRRIVGNTNVFIFFSVLSRLSIGFHCGVFSDYMSRGRGCMPCSE